MAIQRLEVITGRAHRRRFSEVEKQELVAAAFLPGVRATDVARREGLDVSLLYRWRRQFFGPRSASPGFTPVTIVEDVTGLMPEAPLTSPSTSTTGTLEIEFAGGTRIRVIGAVDAATIAAAIAALKGSRA